MGRLVRGHCLDAYNQVVVKAQKTGSDLLLCKAYPESDCDIEIQGVLGPGELPLQKFTCQIERIETLPSSVYRVFLRPPAGKRIDFYAGQYLSVQIPDKEAAFFSIASEPSERILELHIQAMPGWVSAEVIIDWLQQNHSVDISIPYGKACLTEMQLEQVADKTVILIAAGTGFAQMKSIIEMLIHQSMKNDIYLFWGVRQKQDMYLRSLAEHWDETYSTFHFVPVYGDNLDNEWSGHHEQLWQTVVTAGLDLKNSEVFISGSPDTVYAAVDGLVEAGIEARQFHSDVFEYAPRK
jgi:CDP-4-dehydro-6-deoxyglucose reductase